MAIRLPCVKSSTVTTLSSSVREYLAKSPVRACDDVDDTALSYAEIKALATGNPYIKEKMDLDIQVSKLKLLKANHTSQIYSLESDIARRYPREITAAKSQIEALKTDMEAAKPLLAQDKDHFSMEISGKVYTERKDGVILVHVITFSGDGRARGRIAHFDGATGFLIHPVQIGLGIRNFRLNLKNVCTDSICQIFGNFCGDTAGRKIGDKSFAHDNALPLDNFV